MLYGALAGGWDFRAVLAVENLHAYEAIRCLLKALSVNSFTSLFICDFLTVLINMIEFPYTNFSIWDYTYLHGTCICMTNFVSLVVLISMHQSFTTKLTSNLIILNCNNGLYNSI